MKESCNENFFPMSKGNKLNRILNRITNQCIIERVRRSNKYFKIGIGSNLIRYI